jgi:ATP dependent DNA ligase C terminal region.
LQARLKPLIRKTQPYSKKIAHPGIWVEPSLLAEIEYTGRNLRRARCAIRSSRASGRTCDEAGMTPDKRLQDPHCADHAEWRGCGQSRFTLDLEDE